MTETTNPEVAELTQSANRMAARADRPDTSETMRRPRRPLALRYHIHPRLEAIAAAAEAAELSEEEAYAQMIAAAAKSSVLKAMPVIERMAVLDGLRHVFQDPEVLAAPRGEP